MSNSNIMSSHLSSKLKTICEMSDHGQITHRSSNIRTSEVNGVEKLPLLQKQLSLLPKPENPVRRPPLRHVRLAKPARQVKTGERKIELTKHLVNP